MRKLKLQVQMTVDGFMAGPNGEMDWLTFAWDDQLKDYVTALTTPVDCIVLGRKLAQGFIPHWAAHPEAEGAATMNGTPKVVFTHTLTHSEWPGTALAQGELVAEINQLKQQPGGDIIAYGGATFVSALIRHGLIDEYHLFVNPVAIGRGLPIFGELSGTQPLTLVRAQAFACGIVVQHYEPKRG
ncbi:dihydrofolate reductase family protein [Hymenobacter jeollabukensis]|uniref:Dihydrofolate reductase n=1 Tax=Hymenobacter jeollabukensis TaxID=2025313 RepID=A0A5R8WSB9_9BACT|nr:dihydrofolate reductase family protein [Hymenobacter jeollabukensis]TLM94094.1 dihydrofolate reductase [Hymenobacter jeollabukensis]